jgi:phage-related protein (TIGR01555 family)
LEKHKITQLDRIARYADLIQKQAGKAVRPYRADGYVNMMTRYGTQKDASEQYKFVPEDAVPDELLTMYYEGNGLFAKIIDTPAEEAIKHGFELKDVSDQAVEDFYTEALDELDWEETAMTAIKWARLFGGSLAVMLINDGRGLDEPLDWRHIQSIDDIRVFDRSVIQPDYTTLFNYDPRDPFSTRGSRLGLPEYYQIFSKYGSFTVHDSRCLVFQNGILPENTTNSIYQLWGVPEYIRLHRAIRDAEVAHRSAPKMLDRSVQPIYKMQNLAAELATEEGESKVLRRLQVIDMARGLLNSLVIDAEGEDYDFKTFQFSGINDVVSASCNMLSALSNIPQTILFGQAVGGMSSTDDTSMENYYNYVERIQRRMLKSNLRYLLSIIFQAGLATGEVDEVPKIKIKFNPLWSLSDVEQADLEQKREQTKFTRAQTAQIYVNMQAIDPSEVRQKLADSEEFDVEAMLDEYDDDELFPEQIATENPVDAQGQPVQPGTGTSIFEEGNFAEYVQDVSVEEHNADLETGGNAPAAAPAATKLPEDMSAEELVEKAEKGVDNTDGADGIINRPKESVGVLVISDGKVLSGTRHNDFGYGLVCGPGGHVEPGETPTQAAFRETEEEFGISPKELIPLGLGPYEPDTGLRPHLYLCTDYDGEPNCLDLEMSGARFRTMEELDELAASMFQPFADGLKILKTCIDTALFFGDDEGEMHDDLVSSVGKAVVGDPEKEDGGPGSGNHGHEGVPGKVGGSAPKGSNPVPYSKKSDKTKELINKRKDNVMGFGMSDEQKSEERSEFVKQLEKDGAKVEYDQEYDTYKVFDPELSYRENSDVSYYANFGSRAGTMGRDEYIRACKEAGVDPKLHENKEEIPEAYLKKTDGTPVYSNLNKNSVLTDEEISEYSGTDRDLNPEGKSRFEEATRSAIDGMTKEQVSALNGYTSQYGVNYQRVNEYLNGTRTNDEEAKKAAEAITEALDHEVGVPLLAYRGEQDLSHISDNPKVKTMLNKVARGDFSSAEKLKEDLEGREVTSPVVTSTSLYSSLEGFDKLPVQIIYKVPETAKAVDITNLSAYGGGRSSAAAIFGGAMSYETELAFKPGMSYKIERVDFSLTQNGKKQVGQVFITASVNP